MPRRRPTPEEVSSVMAELGSRGGKVTAGKNLAEWRARTTRAERSKAARKAARARWRRRA